VGLKHPKLTYGVRLCRIRFQSSKALSISVEPVTSPRSRQLSRPSEKSCPESVKPTQKPIQASSQKSRVNQPNGSFLASFGSSFDSLTIFKLNSTTSITQLSSLQLHTNTANQASSNYRYHCLQAQLAWALIKT
jgi:hypothetical protein